MVREVQCTCTGCV